jgi:phage anti-repressor protein
MWARGHLCHCEKGEEKMNDLVELKASFERIVKSEEKFPVDFDDAWTWIGYSRKSDALKVLKANFEEKIDFDSTLVWDQNFDCGELRNQTPFKRGGDRRSAKYNTTKDCFKSFCMLAGTPKGKEVRLYFLKIEEAWNTPALVAARAAQMGVLPVDSVSTAQFNQLTAYLDHLSNKLDHLENGIFTIIFNQYDTLKTKLVNIEKTLMVPSKKPGPVKRIKAPEEIKALEDKRKEREDLLKANKEHAYYDFLKKYIELKSLKYHIKMVYIWNLYKIKVKPSDQMKKYELINALKDTFRYAKIYYEKYDKSGQQCYCHGLGIRGDAFRTSS